MAVHANGSAPLLNVGIIGAGRAGRSMIPAILKHDNCRFAGIADRSDEVREDMRQNYQVAVYEDVEALCKNPGIDAVYIATPTHLHAEHVEIAASHGKHIIVEKPIAISLDEAKKMICAVEKNGVKMMVGHSHGFDPVIRKIKEIVDSGRIGKLRMIHNWYFTDWMYRPRTFEELQTEKGGGVTFRQGSHQFDIIRVIGGGLLQSVRADAGDWREERRGIGSHVAFLQFQNGAVATGVYSGYDHFNSAELTFHMGESGQVIDLKESYAKSRKKLKNAANAAMETDLKKMRAKESIQGSHNHHFFGITLVSCEKGDIRQSPQGLFVYEDEKIEEIQIPLDMQGRDILIHEFYDLVVWDKPVIHDGKWGMANLEVCEVVIQSSKLKSEINLVHQVSG